MILILITYTGAQRNNKQIKKECLQFYKTRHVNPSVSVVFEHEQCVFWRHAAPIYSVAKAVVRWKMDNHSEPRSPQGPATRIFVIIIIGIPCCCIRGWRWKQLKWTKEEIRSSSSASRKIPIRGIFNCVNVTAIVW